ncbi:hypothetical protein [Streptomyces alkaliterrae]|uniref:Uncharacterized protein n=1 Tax=Streptomyces alkaliterrae TaxID=2213162 RepID=A0A5P0YKH2_9ACTN|nr:hypothetical protein [Streptomyces alkaliterrae]MBB1252046.1 hypothetical protein [Streptomyces alkaliterrae]MBB1259847.1 hypothetical protein [Streptomyces alkaliterrae]MQS00410.1 hypothetical protein [Streptomyces alkaliterrae]
MNIDWTALGEVFGVSLVATVALVGVFTLGILGSSSQAGRSGGSVVLARSAAVACYALCAAAVAFGIYLIAT